MQLSSPNATLDSGCQTVSIVTSRWSHLSDGVHHSIEWCAGVFLSTVIFTQLRYHDMQINVLLINESVHRKAQLVTKIYTIH